MARGRGYLVIDNDIFRKEDFQPSYTTDVQPVEDNHDTASAVDTGLKLSSETTYHAVAIASVFSSDQPSQPQPMILQIPCFLPQVQWIHLYLEHLTFLQFQWLVKRYPENLGRN